MMNILIYEDDLFEFENSRFVNKIKIDIPDARLHKATSFEIFENFVKSKKMDVIILDIMGAETNISNFETGKRVSNNYIGLELFSRVRGGYYKLQDPMISVIMRTAKADEIKVKNICFALCTEYVFLPGSDDKKIIDILMQIDDARKFE